MSGGLLVWKRSVARCGMGMLLGSRTATGPSGLARSPYRVPSPPRARVGFGFLVVVVV